MQHILYSHLCMHTNTTTAIKITSTFASKYKVLSSTTSIFNKLLPNCFSFIDYYRIYFSFEGGLPYWRKFSDWVSKWCYASFTGSVVLPDTGEELSVYFSLCGQQLITHLTHYGGKSIYKWWSWQLAAYFYFGFCWDKQDTYCLICCSMVRKDLWND